MQRRSAPALKLLGLVAIGITLSGCAKITASATETAICEELRRDLPTWSRADTQETLKSGARFIGVFNAVCS